MKLPFLDTLRPIYEQKYKKLLWVPFFLLILALIQIIAQNALTGDFINRDVSLKGGVTVTIPGVTLPPEAVEDRLTGLFLENDVRVRTLSSAGQQIGLTISIDIDAADQVRVDDFIAQLETIFQIDKNEFTVEAVGSSLGASFFKEVLIAMLIAFVFMGIVVFIYFRTPVPSGAVILAAFSDIAVTLAIVNMLGVKLSSAGIAAFLMLIGYSVDTDILLTTKVIKRREGTVIERVYSAMKTGLTMNITTLVAITVSLILSESEIIRQIMIILLIGLLVDMINTWIQNVGILRWHLEKKYEQD